MSWGKHLEQPCGKELVKVDDGNFTTGYTPEYATYSPQSILQKKLNIITT